MSERWFDDLPEHDPNDPEAVERPCGARSAQPGASRKADRQRAANRRSATGALAPVADPVVAEGTQAAAPAAPARAGSWPLRPARSA